ncbi:MAG: hypothetical protein ACLR8Y_03720 [Alistipes indistinctus]
MQISREPAQEIERAKESAEGVSYDPHSALSSCRSLYSGCGCHSSLRGGRVSVFRNFVNSAFMSTPVDAVDSVPLVGMKRLLAGRSGGTYWSS